MNQIRTILISGSVPTVNQLPLGDIVINTVDGKAYIKKYSGSLQSVVEIGSGISPATASYAISASYATTASYALNGGVTQLVAGTNISLSPVGGTGVVTVNANTVITNLIATGSITASVQIGPAASVPYFFLIQSGSREMLKINTERVVVFESRTDTPTPVTGGMYYSASGDFFLGLL